MLLEAYHSDMMEALKQSGRSIRKNANAKKYLDCASLQYAYAALEEEGIRVQTCRGVYVPSESRGRLWERSWLSRDAHIQLCVRDQSCIIGTWLVEPRTDKA